MAQKEKFELFDETQYLYSRITSKVDILDDEISGKFSPDKHYTFLIGAGASINSPSNLPSARQMVEHLVDFYVPTGLINEIKALDRLRYELIVEAIQTNIDSQLKFLDYLDLVKDPNPIHIFLSYMAKENHKIITTNFDCLIELALFNILPKEEKNKIKPIITKQDYLESHDTEKLYHEGYIPIYKIHGSKHNIITQKDTSESLVTTLSALGSDKKSGQTYGLPEYKQQVLSQLIQDRTLIVIGYSGADVFDIAPVLKNLKIKELFWVEHTTSSNSLNFDMFKKQKTEQDIENLTGLERLLAEICFDEDFPVVRIQIDTLTFIREILWRKLLPLIEVPNIIQTKSSQNIPKFPEYLKTHLIKPDLLPSYKFIEQIAIQTTANNLFPRIVEEALKEAKNTNNDLLEAYALINRGEFLHYDGFCKESNECYTKALAIYEKHNLSFEIAKIYLYIGANFHDLENYDEALKYYDKSIEYAEKSQNWHVMTSAIGNSAVAYKNCNNLPKGIELIKKSIEIDEKYGLLDRKSNHLMRYADMLLVKKEYDMTKKLLQESIQIAKDLGFVYGITTGLSMYAILLQEQKNYKSAINFILEALDLTKKHYLRSTYMDNLSILGGLYIRSEEYDKALTTFEEYLPYVQEKNLKMALANNYYSRAYIYERFIQIDQSLELYQKALELFSETKNEIMKNACIEGINALENMKKDKANLYSALYNITYFYRKKERYEKALDSLKQALDIAKDLNDKTKAASVLNFIGIVYGDMQDSQSAVLYIKQAVDTSHEINDQKNEALYYSNLAKYYKYLNDFENANKSFDQSAKLYQKINEFKEAVKVLKDAGDMEFSLSRNQNAEKYYSLAYEIAKNQGDKESEYTILRKIAGAYRELRDFSTAYNFYSKALDLAKNMKNIHDIGVSLSDLALLEQANKNYTKSMSLYEEAWNYMKSSSSLLNKGILLNVMADNYYYLNDFTQAFSKLESALKIFEELKDFYNIGENRLRKVKYYTKLLDNAEKNNQNADIENYRKNIIEECKLVLESFSKLREKNHEADALEILGDKYKRFGEYKIAIEYYKKSLEIFDRLKMTEKTYSLKDKIASISK